MTRKQAAGEAVELKARAVTVSRFALLGKHVGVKCADCHSVHSSQGPALMRAMAEHLKRQIVVGPRAGWEMDRDSVIARLIASVQPHPDIGKPRLWSHGAGDAAVRAMPWPLEKALCDYPEVAPAAVANTVVQLAPRGRQP